MRFPFGGIGPHGVVRPARLERIVRIVDMEEGKERDVAMRLEPGHEPIHILARRLAGTLIRERAILVLLLVALMEVRELACEEI